jgi:hypothetical protein
MLNFRYKSLPPTPYSFEHSQLKQNRYKKQKPGNRMPFPRKIPFKTLKGCLIDTPKIVNGLGGIRTPDTVVRSHVL